MQTDTHVMCGFVGTVGARPLDAAVPTATDALTSLLSNRGPDDMGLWNDAYAEIGFRRLAVLDLSPEGHQPMISPDGRWVLVFNGEVYNFRELRSELQSKGIAFRSDSDSEVVLHALICWGENALRRFNGMFAIALYDSERRSVLLARDPMGIKPLYWMRHAKGIVFASQYDAIVRHPWCERQRLRPDVAALYLQFGYIPAPYGLVESTGQVCAGSVMSWSPESEARERHYTPWPDLPEHYLTPGEEANVIRSALQDSIKRQLIADVPVGTFLSGGIDSPLVTGVCRSVLGRPIPAFTIGSDSAEFDETDQAYLYGKCLGIDHYIRTITESDALALYDDVFDAFGEPFGDYSAFPTMLVSRLAREHVTVALSGDGGDELFFGYPRMWTALRWRQLFHLPVLVRRGVRKLFTPVPSLRPPETTTLGSLGYQYATMHNEFGGAMLARVAPGLGAPPRDFSLYDLDGVPSADALAQWSRRNEVLGHLEKTLMKVDRASMHESLEVRVPFLDHEIVNAAIAIDPFACMDGEIGKLPLRRELTHYVPRELISKPKRGFGVPLGDWLRGCLADRLREQVIEHPFVFDDAFDRGVLKDIIETHRSGQDRTQQLWNLLTLQEWAGRHLRPLDGT